MRPETIRRLLDGSAMAPLFTQVPALRGRNIADGQLAALWVKPGRHFNASYHLTSPGAGGRTVLASACVLDPERGRQVVAKVGPHAAERAPDACAHCNTLLVQPDLLLQVFPFDYRLPMLGVCADAARIRHSLAGTPSVSSCEAVGYRPGIRCQFRYRTDEGTNVYGKTAVERTPGRTFALQRRVYSALRDTSRSFRVPEPLHYLPECSLTLIAEAPGDSLHTLLPTGRNLDMEIRTVSVALADFHRLDVDGVDRVYTIEDEICLLEDWVRFVALLFPDLAPGLHAAYDELVRTQPNGRGTDALVHRDFYDKQVLLSGHGVTFLDMDTACTGDAEIDLGNFCAQLRLRGLQFGAEAKCALLEHAFLAAYPAAVTAPRVTWYRRSSLLRLACGYALRPNWQHLAPALMEQVRA